MTPLRQRLINDLTVRGLAENTQKSYVQAVSGLAKYYRRSPDQLSPQEIQDYLIYLRQERHLRGLRVESAGVVEFQAMLLPPSDGPWRPRRRLAHHGGWTRAIGETPVKCLVFDDD